MNWPTTFDNWALVLEVAGGSLVIIEIARLVVRRRFGLRRVGEMLANVSTLPLALATIGLAALIWLPAYGLVSAIAPWSIPLNIWTVAAGFLLVDLIYYWEHRISHQVALLWAAGHSVHHSSPVFDISVSTRISFVDNFTTPLFYLPAVFLGFPTELVLAALGLGLAYQTWIHTELVPRLGWFDRWFNSPANHRVHHGSDRDCLDTNYGSVLMIWDRLFGTYRGDVEPERYGLTTQINSVNPWKVHTAGLSRLWRQVAQAPSGQRWRLLAGRPA